MAEAGGADRKERRILRLLSRTAARCEPASASATILLDGGDVTRLTVEQAAHGRFQAGLAHGHAKHLP